MAHELKDFSNYQVGASDGGNLKSTTRGQEAPLDSRRFGQDNKEDISVIQGYQSDASVFKTFKEPEFSV